MRRPETFNSFNLRADLGRLSPIDWPLQKAKIKITERCNHRCPKCEYWKIKTPKDIPLVEVYQFVKRCKELGAGILKITGGEPFLYPHLENVLSFCHNVDLDVGITTNGTAIFSNTLILKHEALVQIAVSIDSFDHKYYEAVTGVSGTYKKLLKGLELIFSVSGENIKVAQVVIDATIIQRLPSLKKLLFEFPFDALSFIPLLAQAGSSKAQWYKNSVEDAVQHMSKWATERGIDVWRTSVDALTCSIDIDSIPCYTSMMSVVACVDGVHPCCTHLAAKNLPICSLADFCKDALTWKAWRFKALTMSRLPCSVYCYGADLAVSAKVLRRLSQILPKKSRKE